MKKSCPIEIIVLGFQVDHITPKKIQTVKKFKADTANARNFFKLFRYWQFKMNSNRNKIAALQVT